MHLREGKGNPTLLCDLLRPSFLANRTGFRHRWEDSLDVCISPAWRGILFVDETQNLKRRPPYVQILGFQFDQHSSITKDSLLLWTYNTL